MPSTADATVLPRVFETGPFLLCLVERGGSQGKVPIKDEAEVHTAVTVPRKVGLSWI